LVFEIIDLISLAKMVTRQTDDCPPTRLECL